MGLLSAVSADSSFCFATDSRPGQSLSNEQRHQWNVDDPQGILFFPEVLRHEWMGQPDFTTNEKEKSRISLETSFCVCGYNVMRSCHQYLVFRDILWTSEDRMWPSLTSPCVNEITLFKTYTDSPHFQEMTKSE